jgi:SAM-dependent methyltransferase
MNKKNILFITHNKSRCGVYDFGERALDSLKNSNHFNFIKVTSNSVDDLNKAITEYSPDAIIYNYTSTTLPWITRKLFRGVYFNKLYHIKIPQIGIIHEITQEIADTASPKKKICITKINKLENSLFDSYIASDPTLLLHNPLVNKTGRVIPKYTNIFPKKNTVTIASFGFGTSKKGFENLVKKVQEEFENAEIKINIPFSEYCDKNGLKAKQYASDCKKLIYKDGIKLRITHNYFDQKQLLDFLAQSSLIAFFYEDRVGRGISSVIDYALAVNRPIAISNSIMFRHILDTNPSICVEKNSLKKIILNDILPLNQFKREWTSEVLLWEYERIINSILQKDLSFVKTPLLEVLKNILRGVLGKTKKENRFHSWLRSTDKLYEDNYKNIQSGYEYTECNVGDNQLNSILNDEARNTYENAIRTLFELVPNTMAKKIPRANVNQGFVFDTVFRFIKKYDNPKILCVGSYEDTACMALIKLGYSIDEIDPMINYTVQDFCTKPNIQPGSYDIIFSTSVIEHDPDDKSFMESVHKLLAINGVYIMSCDFKDGWKEGEAKPSVDARFYTKNDLMFRLPSYMTNCNFVDVPNWSCENPDFKFDKYQYTFSGFVIKKEV